MNGVHCGASVSELYTHAQCTIGYLYKLCIGSLGRVPSPVSLRSINLSSFAQLFLPHVGLSHSRVRSSLAVSLSWLRWFQSSSGSIQNIHAHYKQQDNDYKSVRTCSQLDHAHSVHIRRAYACTGRAHISERFCRSTD